MAVSSKDFAPNLDEAERMVAHSAPDMAQVVLLRAGMLDICMLLKDIRTNIEMLNKNMRRANRPTDEQSQ